MLDGSGSMTESGIAQGIGWYQTNSFNVSGVPNVELLVSPFNSLTGEYRTVYHIPNQTFNEMFEGVSTYTKLIGYCSQVSNPMF